MTAGCTLVGTLASDARAMTTTDGTALLRVVVTLGIGTLPVHATRIYGQGHAAQFACQAAAGHYRKGCEVALHGLYLTSTPARDALTLQSVDHLELRAAPIGSRRRPHSQPITLTP